VLEYVEDPARVVNVLSTALKPNGVLVVLAPHSQRLFGSLDRSMGHKRRYSSQQARDLLESQGFTVEEAYHFNKAGTPAWWAHSKVFGSLKISRPVLKIFDKTVWIWSRLDWLIPWPGLSLIVLGRKRVKAGLHNHADGVLEAVPEVSLLHVK